jgi:hypothetical protein
MTFFPWMNPQDNKEAAILRERSLPPQYQMAGNARYLRDALLSVFILSMEGVAPSSNPEAILMFWANRSNLKAQMRVRSNNLKALMTEEQIDRATTAARELFGFEMDKARRLAANPKRKH